MASKSNFHTLHDDGKAMGNTLSSPDEKGKHDKESKKQNQNENEEIDIDGKLLLAVHNQDIVAVRLILKNPNGLDCDTIETALECAEIKIIKTLLTKALKKINEKEEQSGGSITRIEGNQKGVRITNEGCGTITNTIGGTTTSEYDKEQSEAPGNILVADNMKNVKMNIKGTGKITTIIGATSNESQRYTGSRLYKGTKNIVRGNMEGVVMNVEGGEISTYIANTLSAVQTLPLSNTNTALSSRNMYKNFSNPRGNVYILNWTFQNHKSIRHGADCDSKELRITFQKMGYKVKNYVDLNKKRTFEIISEIKKELDDDDVDCFIMFLLSHGEDDKYFYADDEELIHIDSIRYMFIDTQCPQLKGKPKIFMCNFCRGDLKQIQLENDSSQKYEGDEGPRDIFKEEIKQDKLENDAPPGYEGVEGPRDMVTIHASIDGFSAKRHTTGTLFVQSLCQILSKDTDNKELRDIYRGLEDAIKKWLEELKISPKLGTTPEWQEYLFIKDFLFNPLPSK